jgi:hypothetical protein
VLIIGEMVMSITVLKSDSEINAALAMMSPVAVEAANLLAHRLKENPTIIHGDGDRFMDEVVQVVGISCARNGITPREGNPQYERFVENNIHPIVNVGVSLAMKKEGGSWLKAAALVGIGLITGIGF